MNAPRISVVIPTYNRAGFLEKAVASVRNQSHPCDEIVIVDDGSTDDTPSAVAALGAGVRYVHQPNAGPSAARNRGMREAQGDLVAFLDTDDRWLPTKIERQLALLAARPDVAIVVTDEAMELGDGRLLHTSNFAHHGIDRLLPITADGVVPDAPRRLLKTNFISTSTVLARRDLLVSLGGFDTRLRYGEDLELWLRVAAAHPIASVRSVEAIRVTHGGNTTAAIEPMLLGYVELTAVIRGWARELMPQWGLDPDQMVADSWCDLGYWYFSNGRLPEARQALRRSLRESVTSRALKYSLASLLPAAAISKLRAARASVHQKTHTP